MYLSVASFDFFSNYRFFLQNSIPSSKISKCMGQKQLLLSHVFLNFFYILRFFFSGSNQVHYIFF